MVYLNKCNIYSRIWAENQCQARKCGKWSEIYGSYCTKSKRSSLIYNQYKKHGRTNKSYQNRDVRNEFDEDEFAPENVERNVDRILTHRRTHNMWPVCFRIRLKKTGYIVRYFYQKENYYDCRPVFFNLLCLTAPLLKYFRIWRHPYMLK